jgi:DNA replication protein DnaC
MGRAQLGLVPPAFNRPKLSRLKARPDLHPDQERVIAFVKAHADDSFLFTGKNGSGKSHIAWALYRQAIAGRRAAVACPVRDLLADFRRVEMGVPSWEVLKSPRVTSDDLRRSRRPYLLFLDEFEKARPSEFAAEQLFNVLDAARSFNHQMVVTTNFTAGGLRDHWGRLDLVWGNSIMTRLEDCHLVEMF